ncbi:MAG: UDP-2,4-diacetamido-2,4,6-trideoxy-beta-L-altropyranose hydrolase [Candidatus Nitrospinota bacterium M3_3B_026]
MKAAFRADASPEIGAGHVARLLALAEELARRGAKTFLITHGISGALSAMADEAGVEIIGLSGDGRDWDRDADARAARGAVERIGGVDWLVADRRGIDSRWEKALRPAARRILSIDDLAGDVRDCDLLLNPNHLPGAREKYHYLTPKECVRLTGPTFALIRREFQDARAETKERSGPPRRILVSFGGSAQAEMILKTAEAVRALGGAVESAMFVVSEPDAADERIGGLEGLSPIIKVAPPRRDMAKITLAADIVIGAYGVSTWERMLLGAPSLMASVTPEQAPLAAALADDGLAVYLGEAAEISAGDIAKAVFKLIDDPERLQRMSRKGTELVDGLGAKRVADVMLSTG